MGRSTTFWADTEANVHYSLPQWRKDSVTTATHKRALPGIQQQADEDVRSTPDCNGHTKFGRATIHVNSLDAVSGPLHFRELKAGQSGIWFAPQRIRKSSESTAHRLGRCKEFPPGQQYFCAQSAN